MQTTLSTARLTLRPAGRSDLDALWSLWTAPDVRRYLWDDRVIERDEAAATLADCISLGAGGLGLWVLRPIHGSPDLAPVLGGAGLLPVGTAAESDPSLDGLVEPIVALSPEFCGRGYAHEALAALLRYAVDSLGLTRLAAVSDVPNAASDRMLRRAGFIELKEVAGPRHPLRTYSWEAAPAHRLAEGS